MYRLQRFDRGGQPAEVVRLHSSSRTPEVGLELTLGLGIRSLLASSQGGKYERNHESSSTFVQEGLLIQERKNDYEDLMGGYPVFFRTKQVETKGGFQSLLLSNLLAVPSATGDIDFSMRGSNVRHGEKTHGCCRERS